MVALRDGYKPADATLGIVYECLTGRVMNTEQSEGTAPTFEVNGSGATVNVYFSNSATVPNDETEMTLDSGSPFSEDIYILKGQVKWVLFKAASGSPTIKTLNLLRT